MGEARDRSGVDGFWSFYRRYTDTSLHTATMAGLTAFGLLTFVHRAFVLVAVGGYVLPPVILYLTGRTGFVTGDDDAGADEGSTTADGDDGAGGGAATPTPDADSTGADADAGAEPPTAGTGGTDGDDAGDGSGAPAEWIVEGTPTDATLRDVAALSSGALAVGDGGVVLERADGDGDGDGDAWSVSASDGPAAEGRDLTGVDATDDGAAAWLCGANGAAGRYDAETGRHTDRSAPRGVTDSWTDVAVTGRAGGETVYLANGSGEILRGSVDGGEVTWADPVTPGSGSSIAALDADADAVRACDTSGGAFASSDGGETFERVGIDGASGTFTDVAAGGRVGVRVSADDGSVYRDDAGWTRDRPVERRLAGADVDADADAAVVVGDGGAVCVDGGDGWERVTVPTDVSLEGVSLTADACAAVGDAGTVLRAGRGGVGVADESGDAAPGA